MSRRGAARRVAGPADLRALLPAGAPPVDIWTPNDARRSPMTYGSALNLLDVRNLHPGADLIAAGADLLVCASDAAAAAWQAAAPALPTIVVPAVAEPASAATDRFAVLHLILGARPSPETRRQVAEACAWAAARGIACGPLDPDGPAGLATLAGTGAVPLESGAAMLDLRAGADLLRESVALLQALAEGAPLLYLDPAPFRTELARQGAALWLDRLEDGLDAFAALPASRRREHSAAALAYVGARHSQKAAAAALQRGIAAATRRRDRGRAHWAERTAGMHVLVVSDEAPNLLDLRVHRPFAALRAAGAIAGYAVLRHGEWAFSTDAVTQDTRFGAIWVQRSLDPLVELLLQALGRPFVYDLDDLLLVSPCYRPPFPAESIDTGRSLIGRARVLSCATNRLAALAAQHAGTLAPGQAVVTPNLADAPPAPPLAGLPRAVVWPSSDRPALAGSERAVALAVRDFCLAHRLRLLCIGAEPPASLAGSGVAVEHLALLSYPAYLQRLRDAAPGILLGPLETGADPATQDFIDAKSDIKLIEARLTGLVPVLSRAQPYLDSDLAPPILCDNSYESWLAGLERARLLCQRPGPPVPFPPQRTTEIRGLLHGLLPWAEALARARADLSAADVAAAVGYVRAQGETLLGAPALFDEDDYLRRHRDVKDAVVAGIVASGYRHYVQSGFREGREAKMLPSRDAAAAFWWSRLLHRTGRLEHEVAARERTLLRLRERAALRRALPAPPEPKAAPPGDAVQWRPATDIQGPCPVCDAAGPHPAALVYRGETLAACAQCGASFYAEREPYDYADEAASDLLLQVTLEQNAGIHHQIGPLFAIDGVDSVLDVGCGFGFAVDLASRLLGWRAVGVDPSFYAGAGRAALGADLRQEYLTEETELGGRFGLVLASEVIEHLPEPYAFLALLRRQLAPGGTLVLGTPNAEAIEPGAAPSRLLAMLAPGVHLVLFSRNALALALQRAGFGNVHVVVQGDGLLAYASDRPLRWRADAGARHDAAYAEYLESLLDRAEPGGALWNGAAGRLLAWLAPSADPPRLEPIFARVEQAWRARYGFSLSGPIPAIAAAGAAELARLQPVNLAGVLLARATLLARTEGRTPEALLALARPAYRVALRIGQALQAANIVDHDLRHTAQRARMLALDALAELAPELEAALLQTLLLPSPGALAEWADPAPDAATPRLALAFAAAVDAGQPDEARRLLPPLADLDRLCRTLAPHGEVLLRTLFALGRHRLDADSDAAGALALFERMQAEASAQRSAGPAIADLLHLAEDHMTRAATRLTQASGA